MLFDGGALFPEEPTGRSLIEVVDAIYYILQRRID
jgi:hypothetical protein